MQITKILSILIISSFILMGCTDEDENALISDHALHLQPLGSAAKDLLMDQGYSSLAIEIVSVVGYEPSSVAIDEFRKFLEIHLDKPNGIFINQRSVPPSGTSLFSIEKIQTIEAENRSLFTVGDEITVYVYFADGSSDKDTETNATLGTAYRNTSLVIYEETLRKLSTHPDAPRLSTIEAAALNHEFSHLLGLVNTKNDQLDSQTNTHSDGHCSTKGCLMEATIPFKSGMMDVLGKGIPELDAKCLQELETIKAL